MCEGDSVFECATRRATHSTSVDGDAHRTTSARAAQAAFMKLVQHSGGQVGHGGVVILFDGVDTLHAWCMRRNIQAIGTTVARQAPELHPM